MIMPRSVRRLAPIAAERKTEDEGNDFAAPRQPRRRFKLVRRLLTSRPAAVPLREGRRKRGGGGGGEEDGGGRAGTRREMPPEGLNGPDAHISAIFFLLSM